MKIIWIINVPLPEISLKIKEKPTPYGGWLVGLSDQISKTDGIELSILFPNKKSVINDVTINNKTFFSFKPNSKNMSKRFDEVLNYVKPDIVHIHGTEFKHSKIMSKLCKEKK